MSERHESEPYWQADLSLGEIELEDERYPLRMRFHRGQESYQERRELVALDASVGARYDLHAQPYLLLPGVQPSVAAEPTSEITSNGHGAGRPARLAGEVAAVDTQRSRVREVGNAQGWGYPTDRLIVLWDVLLFDWCRPEESVSAFLLDRVWSSFERLLVETLPETERIVTPSWVNAFPSERWQAFLVQQGYGPVTPQTYSKALG